MIPVTLDDLNSVTPLARWRGLPVERQEAIGAAVVAWLFAELVAEDDGSDTTAADRDQARRLSDAAFNDLPGVVQAAFPAVVWFWPTETRYLAFDRTGRALGEMVEAHPRRGASLTAYRFAPASGARPGRIVDGLPADCLPAWVRREIKRGGSWRAVLPTTPPA